VYRCVCCVELGYAPCLVLFKSSYACHSVFGWLDGFFGAVSATSGGAPHVNEMGLNVFFKEILECLVVMKLYK